MNIQRADASHDLVIRKLADLFIFGPQGGNPQPLRADLLLDREENFIGSLHGIHNAIWVEILDFVFNPYSLRLGTEFIDAATLFGNLIFQLDQRAIHSALLFPDPAALIFLCDAVGDFRSLISILVENADLNEFGVTDFADINHFSEPEDRLFLTSDTVEFFPCLLKPERFDDRIKDFLALNDFKLGGDEARVETPPSAAIVENLQIGVVLIDLHRDA